MANPVILVHGTFAGPKPDVVQWYQPGSDFCGALDRALKRRNVNSRCWESGIGGVRDPGDYFHWGPGDNTWLARAEAAQRLRAFLQREYDTCHIVAHSHGGNVVLEALGWQGGSPASWFSGTVTLLGTPVISIAGRRHKSYVPAFWILLLLGISVGVYRTPPLQNAGYAAVPIVLLLALIVVRAIRLPLSLDVHPVERSMEQSGDFMMRLWDPSWKGSSRRRKTGPPPGSYFFSMASSLFGPQVLELERKPDPALLLINSPQDEAYRLLSGILHSPNPMLTGSRMPMLKRFITGICECWAVSKASSQAERKHDDLSVAGLMTLGLMTLLSLAAVTLTTADAPVSRTVAYWAVVAALASLVVLNSFSQSATDGLSYLYHVVNVSVVFGCKLLKYPFTLLMTRVAKRESWPLLQKYALGLINSPTRIDEVTIEMRPTVGEHQFQELPDDIVADVVNKRDQSAKGEVARFIDSLSASEWSVEAIRQRLAMLNEPGLVHSCYYGLDHEWTIEAIAAHIERYAQAADKLEEESINIFGEVTYWNQGSRDRL